MSSLKCKYCGGTIRVTDRKCPGCGANTSDVIEEFKEAKNKEYQAELEKNRAAAKEVMDNFNKKSKTVGIFVGIIFFLIFGVAIFGIVTGIKSVMDSKKEFNKTYQETKEKINNATNSNTEEDKVYTGSFNETVTGESFSVIVSDTKEYVMVADFDGYTDGVQKSGFKQLALYIKLTNNTNTEVHLWSSSNEIKLLADGVQMTECELTDSKGFRHIKGGNNFNILDDEVTGNASIVGWRGFYVDPSAKSLEFRFDDIVITFDNPVYEG